MDEESFIESIDCRFPYSDPKRALELTEQAVTISADAAFRIVYEVCFVPRSTSAAASTRRDVLGRVEQRLSHPLVQAILPLARDLVDGRRLSVSEQIEVMRRVSLYPGQYSALTIALYAGDPAVPWDEELDRVHDQIVASWLGAGGSRQPGRRQGL